MTAATPYEVTNRTRLISLSLWRCVSLCDCVAQVEWADKFEPYIVVPTRDTPLYEERLVERMRDKMPYMFELKLKGYRFFVLHDTFMVHYPHDSGTSAFWREDLNFRS